MLTSGLLRNSLTTPSTPWPPIMVPGLRRSADRLGGMAAAATTVEVPGGPEGVREVRISSPERLIWPDDGITKLDLALYSVAVSHGYLRALGNRPVTLQRFPEGIDGEEFWT